MDNLQKYILSQLEKKQISSEEAITYIKEIKQKNSKEISDIAIIGVSCRVPMAENPEEFWDNMINGRNCFSSKPIAKLLIENVYKNPQYAEYNECDQTTEEYENLENFIAPFIKDFDKFDAGFFGIPPREARYIDPTQRIFLETVWTALEDAGYSVDNIRDTKTGVYVGRDGSTSLNYKHVTMPDSTKTSGNWEGILASRINYLFNLKGPAILIDTACSSGLVATHQACYALRNGDCDLAIAGGIGMITGCLPSVDNSEEGEMSDSTDKEENTATVGSKDNRIRAFDKKGSGTVFGEGAVTYILKPVKKAISDNDHIYAVIKGSAINCDGASNGITAPNPIAQKEVIIDAWKNAKVNPEAISYIETHGTGTNLGDPIEILGITNAFQKFTDKKQFCGVGSVKTNIGHLIGASGCANVLKVILSMNHHQIPPTIYFEEPNPHINFIDSPVYVVDKLTDWNGGEDPLRAGVSAFGFSGTNCHVVLEEYKNSSPRENSGAKRNIFVLSAKTITALDKSISNYHNFFSKREDMDLEEICYTASIGRGHYNYRVAIIADTYRELRDKMTLLAKEGIKNYEAENIYFKINKVVSDRFINKSEDEITESELSRLVEEASEILEKLSGDDDFSNYGTELNKLAAIYVKGANVGWKRLYGDKSIRKVSLPTYPFDRTHYWGDIKISRVKSTDTGTSEKIHPLVGKCLVQSMNQSIFRVNFNLQKQWVLQEHKIKGFNLVSGTTFIEICKEALRQYYNSDNIVIEDLVFFHPLVVKLEDDDIEAHIIITKENDKENFIVVSKHLDGDGEVVWDEHLRGVAIKHNELQDKIDDFDTFLAKSDYTDKAVLRQMEEGVNADTFFGPRWQCVKSMSYNHDEKGEFLCIEIELPENLHKDLKDGYKYHPGMLDDAIYSGLQTFAGSQLFLPFSYKNMTIYRNLPKHFFSIMRRNNMAGNTEIISGNFILADIKGNVLAKIEECTLKKVNNFNEYVSNSFHAVKWVEKTPETDPVSKDAENILIFGDKYGLADEFSNRISRNNHVVFVDITNNEFRKIDDNHYEIKGEENDYIRLLSDIGVDRVSTIYHMATVNFNKKDYEFNEYYGELNKGLYSLFYLSRTLMLNKFVDVEFVLVSDNANNVSGSEQYYKPANASFMSLAKSAVGEFVGYKYRCIDIDAFTDKKIIWDELLRCGENTSNIAYRENVRYREILAAIDVADKEKKIIEVKDSGVYIITGGTGGLGIEVALSLTQLNNCNICLIARKSLPERDQWDAILKDETNSKLCNLIRSIRQMESKGSRIVVYSADVSNYERMSEVVSKLKKEFGSVHGVIHCAGIAGDGFLFNKPVEVFNEVISPKVFGTVVLDTVTRGERLDFFVMFSSVQSILGGPGQGDYTAANSFMDTYSSYLIGRGIKAHTINWPGWKETGMAFDYNLADKASVFKSLSTQTAISSLNDIICCNLTNVVPSDLDFEFISQFSENDRFYRIEFSEAIEHKLKKYQKKEVAVKRPERNIISVDELVLMGKGNDEYTETEKIVGYIYAAVLNMPEIDIYENFVSMGGNSILATELLKVLNNEFNGILNITDVFSYACVEELASFIDSKKNSTVFLETKETYDDIMDKFESGNIDIDSMMAYFEEE